MMNLILMPAYGVRYRTREEALKDWEDGKDFRIIGQSSYCSIRDAAHLSRRHNRVIVHADDGGGVVIDGHAIRINPLDFLL